MQQDFHQPLFVLADDTVRLAEQMLGKGVRISTECKERFLWRALLSAFLLKACRSLHAIVLLCREGFYYDAAVVARSIAEIAIMADWIAKDSNERSRLFVTHIPVEQKRFVQRLEAAGERIPAAREALERNPEAIEELRQQHDEMGGDSRHRYRWAGCNMTLRRMAAEVNYGDLYDFIYWLFSQRAHSTPLCMAHYYSGDAVRADLVPPDSDEDAHWVLVFGCRWVLLVIDIINDEMGLGCGEEIRRLNARLTQVSRPTQA